MFPCRHIIRKCCLLFAALMMAGWGQAQQTITGQVTSNGDDLPLPGVSVLVPKKNLGTATDMKGNFSLTVPSGTDSLIFSMIGFETQRLPIAEGKPLVVVLSPASNELKEMVVTALGVPKEKKALGYSVGEVDLESAARARDANIVNTIQGKISGVQITKTSGGPGASSRIVIRGNGSIVNNNQPLVVVDGIPIDNTTIGTGGTWGGLDHGSPISDINPDDIASMTILKGPNAAALYGSRALNGVIVITTKSGGGGGSKKLNVSVNSTTSFERAYIVKDFQDEYGAGTNGELKTNDDGIAFFETNRPTTPTFASSWGPRMEGQPYIDWDGEERTYSPQPNNYRDLFRTGTTLTNNVAIGWSDKKYGVRASYTNLRNRGTAPNSTFGRHNASVNGRVQLTDRLSVQAKVNYIRQEALNRIEQSNGDNFARTIVMMPRNISAESLENYEDADGNENVWFDGWNWIGNPFYQLQRNINFDDRDRILGNVSVTYQINDNLTLTGRTGLDYFDEFREKRNAYGSFIIPRGALNRQEIDFLERNSDFLLTYNRKVRPNLELTASVGGNRMSQSREIRNTNAREMIEPDVFEVSNFDPARVTQITQLAEKKINSFYGSGQLAYKNYLFLDVTARNDWSSTLPVDNNSYFYPSVSVAYAFTDHKEWFDPDILSFGKVRVSWAEVGKDADPYLLELLYDSLATFGDITLNGVHNPFPLVNLKPEKKQSFEVGADLRFFKGRFTVDFTYYRERTTNQILRSSVSPASGFNQAIVNAGEIRNRGVELLTTQQLVAKKAWSWQQTINFTKNNNLVVELNDEVTREVLGSQWRIDVTAAEGLPYGALFGYGIQKDANGQPLLNADGTFVRTENPVYLGNATPDWRMGVTEQFSWGPFTASFLVDIKKGGDLYSATNMYLHGYAGNVAATLEGREEWYASEAAREAAGVAPNGYDGSGQYTEAWSATGGYSVSGTYAPGTIINAEDVSGQAVTKYLNPEDYWSQYAAWTQEIHEPFVYDASFVKLRELIISYQVPASVAGKLRMRDLSVSLVGRNLWLIYSGVPNVDPEGAYSNGNGQGVEWATFPMTRSIGLNLKASF